MRSDETHRGNREAIRDGSYGRVLYNRFRYYDPGIGRYVSADPIGQAGGVNVFAYARNNPLNLFDWLGLDWEVRFTERGKPGENRTSDAYGADVTVTDTDTGETAFEGRGSSYANDETGKDYTSIEEGSYSATNTTMSSPDEEGNPRPGLFIGSAPGTGGEQKTDIFVHCGSSDSNRGSTGCLTVAPDDCAGFFSNFGQEEGGITVTVTRP